MTNAALGGLYRALSLHARGLCPDRLGRIEAALRDLERALAPEGT